MPFAQALAAALLDPGHDPGGEAVAVLWGDYDGDIAASGPVFADGRLSGVAGIAEDPCRASSLIVLVEGGFCRCRADACGVVRDERPGLPRPPLAQFRFTDVEVAFVAVDAENIRGAAAATRLILAARALGAARRGFALVIGHVGIREQFGQPLVRFQAMQMKLADCHVALTASAAMIDAAAVAVDRGAADAPLRIDAAVAFAAQHLRAASFELQHAFGAIGYAEEHEMPGHFRRIHTDLLLMGGIARARRSLAAAMLDGAEHRLPRHDLGAPAEHVRARLIEWLAQHWTPADRAAHRAKPFVSRNRDAAFSRRLGDAGWLSAGWPTDAGGGGVSPLAQLAIVEELTRVDAPVSANVAAAWLIAPEIIRHGSSALRDLVLPGIRSGVVTCALGYSEPEAGSDLSALRTRAVRDGDAYRITGQKLWGTGADSATHIVVAARTDPYARPKRAGISLFLVPTDLPGITIVSTMAFYGHSFSTQFYDDVRIPATMMIGAENDGWGVLTGALAAERIQMGGNVVRLQGAFEALCAHLGRDRRRADDPLVRDTIGALAAEIEAARLLARQSVEMLEAGGVPIVEGAVTKVFSGALAERFAVAAMDLIGSSALGGEDAAGTPLDGRLEWLLRQSIMMVIGGGAAEIQKGIIAAQWRAR